MKFVPNVPVETKKPIVVVDPGLSPGPHRFRLIVENKKGLQSKPAEIVVTVKPG